MALYAQCADTPAKSILDNILRVYKQTWRCIDGTKQETWFAAEDMLGIQTESHVRDGKQRQESSDREQSRLTKQSWEVKRTMSKEGRTSKKIVVFGIEIIKGGIFDTKTIWEKRRQFPSYAQINNDVQSMAQRNTSPCK